MTILSFMPKTSIELFVLFKVSYCFFFFTAAAEASAIEEVGSGEIDLELGFLVSDLAWKNLDNNDMYGPTLAVP